MTASRPAAAGVATPGADAAAPPVAVPRSGTPNLLGPSFDGVTPVPARTPAPEPAVRIDGVSKRFGRGPLVLDDVALDIAPGEFV